jgi:ABC-type multidrug transport system ATPase subunit
MLQLVDRVIVLDQGRIVLDGLRDEVLRTMTGGERRIEAASNVRELARAPRRIEAA